jgi:hypothetical protein
MPCARRIETIVFGGKLMFKLFKWSVYGITGYAIYQIFMGLRDATSRQGTSERTFERGGEGDKGRVGSH